jgi:hypothetical protein
MFGVSGLLQGIKINERINVAPQPPGPIQVCVFPPATRLGVGPTYCMLQYVIRYD